jgi:quinohemoprotein ethanol dehydrogenase
MCSNNGGVPNLRYSRAIASKTAFSLFTLGGIAEERGMPNFSDALTSEDVEQIRVYMIKRANDLKQEPEMP